MAYDEYRRICALREAADAAEAATEPASVSPQDQPAEAAKEEPASGDATTPSSPTPGPSTVGEGSREESATAEPTPDPSRKREGSETCRAAGEAGRSGVGTGETGHPDPQPHSEPSGVPTQDWLARGLKHPAGRGWETDAPASPETPAAPDRFESIRKFDIHARVRFLDALASHGEVSAAAARAGISRETAYRARRRYPDFSQLWDAAMVHARTRAEAELATRALDGVEVPILVRGEQVGAWRRHDARYLFAHLARLDRHVEAHPEAAARAGRFDEMLAAMAGYEMPEEFAEACPEGAPQGLPPTRDAVIACAHGAALAELKERQETAGDEEEREAAEAEAMEWVSVQAGEGHDLWVSGAFGCLDRVLECDADEEEDEEDEDGDEDGEDLADADAGGSPAGEPLIEYKAFMPGSPLRAKLHRGVSHVSTGGPWLPPTRPEEGRGDASLPSVIPANAGTQSGPEQAGSPPARG